MLIILKVHVQTLRHLGMIAFNNNSGLMENSVADIRLLINFFMLVSHLLMVSLGEVRTPHPPRAATVMYGRRKMVSLTNFQFVIRCPAPVLSASACCQNLSVLYISQRP